MRLRASKPAPHRRIRNGIPARPEDAGTTAGRVLRAGSRSYDLGLVAEYRARGWWGARTTWDLLAGTAERFPDALFVADEHRRLTFREGTAAVRRLARFMRGRSVGVGSVVAIQSGNGSAFVLLHHAAAFLGATTLPLPLQLRHGDLRRLLCDGDADLLVVPAEPYAGTTGHPYDFVREAVALRSSVPSLQEIWAYDGSPVGHAEVLPLDPFLEALPDECVDEEPRCDPRDDFLMLPTAGTSGEPKLVLRSHEAWLAMAEGRVEGVADLRLGSGDVLLSLPTLAQGVGYITGVLVPLLLPGLGVYFATGAGPATVLELLARERIAAVVGVPAQLAALMDAPEWPQRRLGALRVALTGGAAFPEAARRRWEHETGVPLLIAYGASDVDLVSSTAVSDPPERRFTSVGRPLTRVDVRIVADDGRPLPRGEVGEVAVRGPGRISAFYGDEAKTRAIAPPGAYAPLGDLGVLDGDGYLRIVGRKKDIVVRGGQNVSASEVEALLERHPLIREAAVVAVPDERLGESVFAYVVLDGDVAPPTRGELASFLRDLGTARYKIPDRVATIASLPLTAAGKVDKRLLQRSAADSARGGDDAGSGWDEDRVAERSVISPVDGDAI